MSDDIDLNDPATLYGIYRIIARKLLAIHPPSDGVTDSEALSGTIEFVMEQHAAGLMTVTADGDILDRRDSQEA